VAMGRQAVPVCAECRARGLGTSLGRTSYMIHIKGGRSRGPMGRDDVIRSIGKGKCGPEDSVSAVGGERSAMADHPDFRTCFIPGSDEEKAIQEVRLEIQGIQRRAVFWQWMGRAEALAALCLCAGSIWFGSTSRLLIMPEAWMVEIEERVSYWQASLMPGPVFESPPTAVSLPHESWVAATVADQTGLALHEGIEGLWWSGHNELETVRRSFLSAMARSPLDPVPLAGLIEVDALMLRTRPDLLSEIARAKSRLEVLDAGGPLIDATEGALHLAQGQSNAAGMVTEKCAKVDPMCALIHAEAVGSVEEVERIRAKYGSAPRIIRSLARTALVAKDWRTLGEASLALTERFPDDPAGFQMVAEYHASLGEWTAAAEYAEAALGRGSERADMVHLQASVALLNRENASEVEALFEHLVDHPNLAAHTQRQTVLVQAAQAKVTAGDLVGARAYVDAAIESHSSNVFAQVMLADVLYRDGQDTDAVAILRQLATGGLDREESVMVHLWVGRLFFQMGQHRMGDTELEQILYSTPAWGPYLEEQTWAQLSVQDIVGAIATAEGLAFSPRVKRGSLDPRLGGGLVLPPRRKLIGPMLRAMAGDVRHEPKRESIAAILSWWFRRPGHLGQLYDAMDDHGDHLALNAALARASFEDGDWEAAAAQALVVLGRKPGSNIMHSVRGQSLAKLGRWSEGVDSLRRSVRGDGVDTGLLCAAALAWIEHGDVEEAGALLALAQESAPKDSRVRGAMLALDADKK
jgi:predicted Zn-dependent protease